MCCLRCGKSELNIRLSSANAALVEIVTVGSAIATGLGGWDGSWQSELLNMALTQAKASFVASVTFEVMSGSLSVCRVGEVAAACCAALLLGMLPKLAFCRGPFLAAAFDSSAVA